eukprot:gene42350-51724_t
MPTVNLNYQSHPSYLRYLQTLAAISNQPRTFSFGTYYYKGLLADGQCADWTKYTSRQLTLPLPGFFYSALSVDFNNQPGGSTGRRRNDSVVCRDRGVLASLFTNLASGAISESNCEGRTWRTFACNGHPVLCGRCRRMCVHTVACPGTLCTL